MTAARVRVLATAATALLVAGGAVACSSTTRREVPPATDPAATITSTTAAPTTTTTTTSTTAAATTTAAPRPVTTTSTTAPHSGSVHATAAPAPAAGCPANLADSLAATGPARQLITAVAQGWSTPVVSVEIWQRTGACWTPAGGPWSGLIGQNGFSDHHIEGDSTTPTGRYAISPDVYGNAPDPGVRGTYHRLVCGDWWDEDPGSPGYNTFQHVPCGQAPPFGGGSEALWTETNPYPSFAVIDYNTAPAVPYRGSGIFFHAYVGVPTTGCVSIPLPDLDLTLRWLDPAADPAIVMGPAAEITRF